MDQLLTAMYGSEMKRWAFRIGDYVELSDGSIARVDGIFAHDLDGVRRGFAVVTIARVSEDRHAHLGLPFVDDGEPHIIGITTVKADEGQYVIADKLQPGSDTPRHIWVTWRVKFL